MLLEERGPVAVAGLESFGELVTDRRPKGALAAALESASAPVVVVTGQ